MPGNEIRMTPEFALVAALEMVPALRGKVSAMQPKKDVKPPFTFYVPMADRESECLDGSSGLQSFEATVHLVAASHRGLQLISAQSKAKVHGMRSVVYRTPAEDEAEGLKGAVLIENTTMVQSSPDLYESEVGFYRRVYTVSIDYQTENVIEDEEVFSG